jgi:PTS system nitrogen regulatory IIA component
MDESCCFLAGMVQDLSSTDKFDAISELIHKAPVHSHVTDLDQFEDCVVRREKVQSTGLGHGVAVAHGKTDLVDRIVVALGISREGIPFDSHDERPVQLLFLIASPPESRSDYLMTLSALAGMIRTNGFKQELLSSATPDAAQRLISDRFRIALREKCRKAGLTPAGLV